MSRSGNQDKRFLCDGSVAVEALERRALLTSVVVNSVVDSVFPSGSGMVSLRNAIVTANASTSNTTITFDSTVFAAAKTITLNGTALQISNTAHPTTITAPSVGVTLDAGGKNHALVIDAGVTATLSGITVTRGVEGAISNNGTLVFKNGTISNSTGSTGSGGLHNAGTATLTNVTVSGNTAYYGGGILNPGSITLTNVTLSGNTSTGVPQIYGSAGAGIYSAGTAKLINVTSSGNTGTTGVGVYVYGGSASLANVTIANNAGGSAIYNNGAATNVSIVNTIVAVTKASGVGIADAEGSFNSLGHNIIGATGGSAGWNSLDQTGTVASPVNPKLGALVNNGGATKTNLPATGSPAINHGANAFVPAGITTDQRGLTRIAGGTVDIGAVEIQPVVVKTASIAGRVFADPNNNGVQNTGENGIAGVILYNDANNNNKKDTGELTVTTDSGGNYSFKSLAAGSYLIREVLTSGRIQTSPAKNAGWGVTLTAGQVLSGKNFGQQAAGSISGVIFNDGNNNAKRDTGELGLGLWTVYLDLNNNGKLDTGETSVTSDILGKWSFGNLATRAYAVRVIQVTGTATTTPAGGVLSVNLTAGQVSGGHLFGERAIA